MITLFGQSYVPAGVILRAPDAPLPLGPRAAE